MYKLLVRLFRRKNDGVPAQPSGRDEGWKEPKGFYVTPTGGYRMDMETALRLYADAIKDARKHMRFRPDARHVTFKGTRPDSHDP
jgi:hypothetical protein